MQLPCLLPEGKALEDAASAHAVLKGNLFGLLRWLGQEHWGTRPTPRKIHTLIQEVSDLMLKQAEQLEVEAKMITKVTLG